MENDAISRSAVLEQVVEQKFDFPTAYATGYNDAVRVMREKIWSTPALDVAPVVHARWVPSWEPLDLSDVYFRCSACHTNFNVGTEIDMEMAKYCPKCGARMDGETDVV